MAILDGNGKDFFEGFFDRPLAEPEVPNYLSDAQKLEYGKAAEEVAQNKRLSAVRAALRALPGFSTIGNDPNTLTYTASEVNPMDLAAWEEMQKSIEAAGGKRMPVKPGTNMAAATNAALNPLDQLIAGLFGLAPGATSKSNLTVKPGTGTSRNGMNNSIAVRPQDRGNASYVQQARDNAEIGPSGSSRGKINLQEAIASGRGVIYYSDGTKSKNKPTTPTTPTTPATPTTPTTPGPVQALDIPYVKQQSLWIQDLVKKMFSANLGVSKVTAPKSTTS